jgi:geranylgeranyl pyrophosphate synthase
VPRSDVPPPVTRVLDVAQSWLPRLMGVVEARLGAIVGTGDDRLATEAAATLAAGGKRLRPMLVLVCSGPDAGDGAIRAATAVELVHMATLVHDDVLDAAPLRRGLPTVVARTSRDTATAVGDLLFSRAFAELSDAQGASTAARSAPPFGLRLQDRRVALLANASVGLAQGELAQRRDAFNIGIDAQSYLDRCRLKTARLFECACVIGADHGPATTDALIAFGRDIGLAFQLLDDVLDVSGPAERTGKARGTDLLDGTVTMPLILAREADPSLAELDLASLDADGADAVCDRIAATGVLDAVRTDAAARVQAAKRALEGADLSDQQRELLTLVADGVVERYS